MGLCKCGCGEEIAIKRHHRWAGVPDYIHGHNAKGRIATEKTRKLLSEQKQGDRNPGKRPEVRQKMSEKALTNWRTPGYRETHSGENAPMRGKHQTAEAREKVRARMIGCKNPFFGRTCTTEHKRKISAANIGRKQTEQERIKRSIASRASGKTTWNGGSSFAPYSIDFTKVYREQIRERDGHTCQLCGRSGVSLAVHHIDYDRMNTDPQNLISLCISCHPKTNRRRSEWIEFFKGKAVVNA